MLGNGIGASPLLNPGYGVPTPLLPNPVATAPGQTHTQQATLGLNQIENFEPVREFVDETNTPWRLAKAASDSTVDVPDPKNLQIVDYWNHEFPGIKSKLYCYVVEGVKPPRVETEQPMRVLYQWFSTVFIPAFTPAMITEQEWRKANVYAAPVVNARVSKLHALCKVKGQAAGNGLAHNEADNKLLVIEGLSDAGTTAKNSRRHHESD